MGRDYNQIVRSYLGHDVTVPSLNKYRPQPEKFKQKVARMVIINPVAKTIPRT